MSRCARAASSSRPGTSGGGAGAAGACAVAGAAQPPAGGGQGRACRPTRPQPKSTIPKRGPPPAPPKKVDYKKPGMTKAMAQRLKHTQKLQEEMERKERAKCQRRPIRTAAPLGGDVRFGRERRPRPVESQVRGTCPTVAAEPPPCPAAEPPPCPPAAAPCPSRGPSPSRGRSPAAVSARTCNLAESMNADILQAEPLNPGMVDNIIIPPGAINSEKTTIVSIPQPVGEAHLPSSTLAPTTTSQCLANRSAQLISETLDEQDATESAIVNSKLQDLQQARRDFVMAVANVGGNAINLPDDDLPNVTPIADISPPCMMSPEPPSPRLMACPDIDDPYLQVEYGRHHPDVEAARDYLRGRRSERRIDESFQRVSYQPCVDDIDQEYLEGCALVGGVEEDDDACIGGDQYTAIPRRNEPYHFDPYEMINLEKFCDLRNYPPPPSPPPPPPPTGPPPGRECLHPDLWELDDPWYKEASVPDLIEWRSC